MEHHDERMKRIRDLLAQVDQQEQQLLEISERITRLREQIRREVEPVPAAARQNKSH